MGRKSSSGHRKLWVVSCLVMCCVVTGLRAADVIAFDRILSGWTNYSTAFTVTHDAASNGEYATCASFHTPPLDDQPLEYSVVVIWFGSGGQKLDFANFSFQVHCWSSLETFRLEPGRGDLAAIPFVTPTGGSTTVPNAITRGGRPAYLLSFDLSGAGLALERCRTYLIGISAQATSPQAGELYVPTAPFDGLSDVQAGNIVPFGLQYLVDAGGQTLFAGQLATRLVVRRSGELPRLDIGLGPDGACLEWPGSAGCFGLEAKVAGALGDAWLPVQEESIVENGRHRLCLPAVETSRMFRLRSASGSVRMVP